MKQESDWKRITLLRKTSFNKEIKNIGRLINDNPPRDCRLWDCECNGDVSPIIRGTRLDLICAWPYFQHQGA
jgi:hypothetical protein